MENIDLQNLLKKYKTGSCNREELALLENWYLQWKVEPNLLSEMELAGVKDDIWKKIDKETQSRKSLKLWPRIGIAAAVAALILSTGIWFLKNRENGPHTYASDVAPGRVGATLTLSTGQKINLTDATNGKLAEQSGVIISKSANGQLVYEIKEKTDQLVQHNILSTAKGETYKVRLPDGSLIWLNAASSLTFSSNLNDGGKRKVKLSGEAYFEIAKDATHPFIVESFGQEVEVLGTHFNINAYQDEDVVRTSLIEGRVKVSTTLSQKMLAPGQEALKSGNDIQVQSVNAELASAWKNGKFIFDNKKIGDIMKMIARWYDVQIIYEGEMPEDLFLGSVSRFDQVSQVLNVLESTGRVHFKIDDRKIYVSR